MKAMMDCFVPSNARISLTTLFAALLIAGCATHAPPERREPVQVPPATVQSTPEPIAPPHAPPAAAEIDPASQRCLALTMYWEARGEGRRGMEAVGAVVLNRVADPRFPKDVCGVIYQGGERPPCQFSWWCDGRSDHPKQQSAWTTSLALAAEMLEGAVGDPTDGALYFSQISIPQPAQRIRTARIGNHAFYK
jgi:spore germination cell wall hydrolase CwlJ-like protein